MYAISFVLELCQALVADEIRGTTGIYEDPANSLVGHLAFNDNGVIMRPPNSSQIFFYDDNF